MEGLDIEAPADGEAVEDLFDLCFAPGREALSSYRLREAVDPIQALCLVARDGGGGIGGAIRAWPVRVGPAAAALVGPVAVHPIRQGEGLGGALMRAVIGRAETLGWTRLMLVGDAPYYGRFGFTVLEAVEMPPPTNPARVLGLGAWEGVCGPVRRWSDGSPPLGPR